MNTPMPPPTPPPRRPSGPPQPPARPPLPARAEATFNSAIERPAAEREAFIAGACGEDAEMAAEVRALLAAHEEAGDFMPDHAPLSPEIEEQLARLKPEEAGDRIGPYKLLQEIGQGGFGTVWMADQEKPVRRRVALKIIKMGMDTKEVIARFEQERQALAMMDHPNIARVFDAGATQYGRPFFVMELVRGVKITDYCDEQGLSTAERIGLFIHVCQAVQHAHQKGIIHRDLKPSNILVTINDGEPVPKVIDFGVAKATQGGLTDGTLFTKFEQMIGTPLYMSPEQAEMTSLDVDTRSDIYALGVLLYELLTGRTPIDTVTMAQAGMDEIRRLIREVDPPRPSQRLKTLDGNELTTMAKRRHTEPAKLSGTLRGDLDWIVMKCLEKDRKRRYDTANGLALDLQRHLKNEVVIARPPTTAYLLSKLIRRNKSAVAAGCTVALALIVGFAASVWQARRAQKEATRAKTAEQHSAAALEELKATAPAFAEQARGLAAKERYDEAIEKLDYAIKLRPDMAEFLVQKGDLLQCQLRLADAAAIYREALRVKPDHARAETSAKLCDELLAAPTGPDGKLTRESLGKLNLAMQKQQRPAAELLPVARLLGEEQKHLIAFWLERLKDLPIPAEKPLKDRLTVREDGLLELDLQGTQITDLAPLAGMPLGKLVLWDCKALTDFTPLREFRSLTYLDLDVSLFADLSLLRGLPLQELHIGGTRVSDLAPLRGLKLKTLGLYGCRRVSDLSPLAGMPLTELYLMEPADGTDYSPLKTLPLEKCIIHRSSVTDLSFLAATPLKELSIHSCTSLRGLAWLSDLKSLERLVLPGNYRQLPGEDIAAIAALRTHPRLQFIQADSDGGRHASWRLLRVTQSKEIFWQDWDREQAFLPAIRAAGFEFSLSKLPTGTYRLSIDKQPLSDLSMLKGAPISELFVNGSQVTDLAPIAQLPLRMLRVWGTPLADLSPLRGTKIEDLSIRGTKVSDLSALKGLPLTKLFAHDCQNLADVSPLAEIPTLEKLTVPITAQGIEKLQVLTNLKWLAFHPDAKDTEQIPTSAETFWKRWPSMAWSRALNETGMSYSAKQDAEGIWSVTVTSKEFRDCSIFKDAPINELILNGTSVADLRPLEKLPLTKLELRSTPVTDLTPLRAPTLSGSLREAYLSYTRVTDFSPLAACTKLEKLVATGTALADLSILRDHKLTEAMLGETKVTDISVLAGMPLKLAALQGTVVTDLSPLLQCPKLERLVLPESARNVRALKALKGLKSISERAASNGSPAQKAADFWKEYEQSGWRIALREEGIKPKTLKKLEDGTWDVNLDGTKISDLGVLAGAPISSLNVGGTAVTDLTPLRGLPLTFLNFHGTKVRDLSPLQGMALDKLTFGGTPVADLTPLRGMLLKSLGLGDTLVADLSALRGMPLVEIKLHRTAVTDLSPLADAKTLEVISLPANAQDIEFLRAFPKILRISFTEDPKTYVPTQTTEEFWKEYDEQRILSAIPGAAGRFKKLEGGGWELDLSRSDIADLRILTGAPITSLNLGATAVADLTPLRGLPLKKLTLFDTKVTDLSPLKEMPLEELNLRGTPVTDLSPLRGMPLTSLRLQGSGVTDLSPLADCKTLKTLVVPASAKEVEFLRSFSNLERLSYEARVDGLPTKSAEEFWTEHDDLAWLRALPFAVNRVKKLPDGSWDIDFHGAQISDIALLRGKRISRLGLGNTAVTNLSPLREMPLVHLNLYNTKVTDLSPLAGMLLARLSFSGTEVTDISVLRGMPLTTIRMHNCKKLTDLSPLAGLKDLEQLTLPANAKDIGFLRDPAKFPKLKRLSFIENPANHQPDKTAAEFWREWDARKK